MFAANNGFSLIREVIRGSGSVLRIVARSGGRPPGKGGGMRGQRTEIIGADRTASKRPRIGARSIRVTREVKASEDSARRGKTGRVAVRKEELFGPSKFACARNVGVRNVLSARELGCF